MTPSRTRSNTTGEHNEAVARDALLVAHRTQAMHAAGGQIGDQPRIVRGRPAEMVPDAIEQRGQIVFADAQIVELVGRGDLLGVGQGFYLFKNRFMHRWRRQRGRFVRAGDGRAVRNGGGTKFGSGRALKLRVELFDFGFEGGNLVVERARTVGNRIVFFLRGPHTTNFSGASRRPPAARPARPAQSAPAARSSPGRTGTTRQNWHWRTATAGFGRRRHGVGAALFTFQDG